MAATLTGIVFNDLNSNGQYDAGEPGIAGAYVVLSGTAGCTSAITDANGNYSFSAVAGTYTIYETVEAPNACPPTNFSQPAGFNVSNGPRKRTITVTAAQSNNGATISGNNFSHELNTASFVCNAIMIQFAGIPTVRYNIDLVTGLSTSQGTLSPAHYVNAIGENPLDSFIYGYDQTTNNIVRIDSNNAITTLLPIPPGLPTADYTTGAFDANGFFYLYAVNTARYYVIDLRPNSATYLKLVNPAAGYVEQTSNFGVALSTPIDVSDWAINPLNGNLYGVNRSGNVVRVVPTSGAVTVLSTTGPKEPNDTSYGAVAFDFNGNFYAIANQSGTIRKYTISGNTANGALFSQSAVSSNNDGTMCFFATVDVDYGDAPDLGAGNGPGNYNTLLANNGPRHGLINQLFLGTKVTAEADAYQNFDATGDDILLGVQDDGVITPLTPLSSNGGIYNLNVTLTNQTGQTANLYGWIDFNQNGLFENNEAAPVVLVPSAAGTQVLVLKFTVPAGIVSGHTFVRIRLTTNNLVNTGGVQDTRSVGSAIDGEVEDYIINVTESADLSVVKSGSPKPVLTGNILTYSIVVNNAGPNTAENAVLTDAIPPQLQNPEYSIDGGITWQPWPGSLSLGNVLLSQSLTIFIRGTIISSATGDIENTAIVASDTFDPNLDNNTSTDLTPVIESADLAVTKVGAPSPVLTGNLLTYTININNFGPSDALDAQITDVIPPELSNPEYSTNGGITWQPWTGVLNLGTIVNGEAITLLIRGTVNVGATGVISNTVSISSPTPDPNLENNTDTVLTPINNSADLAVTKNGSPKPVTAGNQLIYGITVLNNGPDTAINVVATDIIPAELENPEYSTNGGTTWQPWTNSLNLGNIAANASISLFIRGTVSLGATGTIENTITVSSDTPDPNPDNNTSTDITPINQSADLSLTKAAMPNPVNAGELLTYALKVFNAGPNDAINTTLTDAIPSEITNPEFSVDGSPFLPWVSPLNLGTVNANQVVTVTIRGVVAPSTPGGITILNTAVVSSETPDPNPDNNTDEVEVLVNISADLAVTKLANSATAVPGELLTYTVTVSNLGPSDAEAALLIDEVSSDILNPEFSLDGGITWNPWLSPYSIGIVAAGTSVNFLLRGTVANNATNTILNTATVTSSTPDPNPDNNTSTDETPVEQLADISVIKTANPNPVATGFNITYTVLVQNFGPATSKNVLLTDFLPVGTIDAEFSVDNGASFSPWSGTLLIGDMQNGESVTILIRAIVTEDAASSLSNTAVVSSTTQDPNPENNSSTVIVEVELSSDLSIIKTASAETIQPGQLLTYTLTVQNLGPGNSFNTLVSDIVSPVLNNVEYSLDGGITWAPWVSPLSIGTLINNQTAVVLIRGTASENMSGKIVNTATVSSSTPDPNPNNNTSQTETCICPACATAVADLAVTKSASSSFGSCGKTILYSIVIQNNGPDVAENVVLNDNVSSNILNPQYSVDGGATWQPWVNPLTIGTLNPFNAITILIKGQIALGATGFISNTAVVSSNAFDPNFANNISSTEIRISSSTNLKIDKTAFPNQACPGNLILYFINVTNLGNIAAQNVVVSDNLGSAVCNAQYSLDQGHTWKSWNGNVCLGTIPPHCEIAIQLRGIVDMCACGVIKNVATVTSETCDAKLVDNKVSITVPVSNF